MDPGREGRIGRPYSVTRHQAMNIRAAYSRGMTMKQLERTDQLSHATISAIIRGTHGQVRGMVNLSRGRGMPRGAERSTAHRD